MRQLLTELAALCSRTRAAQASERIDFEISLRCVAGIGREYAKGVGYGHRLAQFPEDRRQTVRRSQHLESVICRSIEHELEAPIQLRGVLGEGVELKLEGATPGNYHRFIITLKGREVEVKRNDQETQRFTHPGGCARARRFRIARRRRGGRVHESLRA